MDATTPLPTGTVTFLFTDIEGSTRRLQHLGERSAAVLAEHHRLLRAAFHPGAATTPLCRSNTRSMAA